MLCYFSYLCGTEEGFIHRCSTSYNEQYLDTYKGHTGPVYKLAWSPFLKNCFLSASGDWSIRLWKMNRTSPCLSFSSASVSITIRNINIKSTYKKYLCFTTESCL